MKKTEKIVRILLFTLLIAALAATLSACSIIESLFKTSTSSSERENKDVTSVAITAGEGLTADGDGYVAVLGRSLTVSATVEADGGANGVTFAWYVKKSDATASPDPDSEQTGSTFSFTPSEFCAAGYELYCIAGGNSVKSNTIEFSTEYAGIETVEILPVSEVYNIVEGVVTLPSTTSGNVSFKADWNKSNMDPAAVCTVEWFVGASTDSVGTGETYALPSPGTAAEITLRARVSVGETSKDASITVKFVLEFEPVESVSVAVNSGAEAIGSGETKQYRQLVASASAASPVTLSVSVNPTDGTNTNASVVWTIVNKNGTSTRSETGRTFSYTPVYGENYLTASVENVACKHVAIIALTSTDYAANESEIGNTFIWRQGVYNRYLSSQSDLDIFVSYIASKHQKQVEYSYSTGNGFDITGENGALSAALGKIEEAGSFSLSGNGSVLKFTDDTVFGNPSGNFTPATSVTQIENVLLHYSEIPVTSRRTALPIDSMPAYPEAVTNSDTLYRVLGWGYKPTFNSDTEGTRLSALYSAARNVLYKYVSDDMSDYEKVRAIYEWIAQSVEYDYAIVENTALTSDYKLSRNAFFLEGVFSDADGEGHGQAVCDGRSKAFVLLCGMEGITAVRITGEGKGEGHAWNKVLLDPDGDGVRNWYMCDTTWSDRSGSDHEEKQNMQYFLVTDSYVSSSHAADADCYNPAAVTEFDYYSSTVVENGDDDFDLYVENNAALQKVVEFSIEKGIYLDIKVNPMVAASSSVLVTRIRTYMPIGYTVSVITTDQSQGLYLIYVHD